MQRVGVVNDDTALPTTIQAAVHCIDNFAQTGGLAESRCSVVAIERQANVVRSTSMIVRFTRIYVVCCIVHNADKKGNPQTLPTMLVTAEHELALLFHRLQCRRELGQHGLVGERVEVLGKDKADAEH